MIDDLLPAFDVESVHSIRIEAPAHVVYAKAWALDLAGSPVIRTLFAARGLPSSALTRSGLEALRFKVLRHRPGEGFVLGLVGRFWTPSGRLVDFDPGGFVGFGEPGHAKAVWAFAVTPQGGEAALLRTVTRVRCLDDSARRRFRLYWLMVGPFSGLIRREILRVLRRQSEGAVDGASG